MHGLGGVPARRQGVIALLPFRFFVVFTKVACIHCRAKNECPNAQAMGIGVKHVEVERR